LAEIPSLDGLLFLPPPLEPTLHCPAVGASGLRVAGLRSVHDPTIDTTCRTGKLIMGILALIAEFENDIRRERRGGTAPTD
jgi:hypothetical protein